MNSIVDRTHRGSSGATSINSIRMNTAIDNANVASTASTVHAAPLQLSSVGHSSIYSRRQRTRNDQQKLMKNQKSLSRAMTLEENETAVDAPSTTKSITPDDNNAPVTMRRRNKPTAARSRSMPIAVDAAMNGEGYSDFYNNTTKKYF